MRYATDMRLVIALFVGGALAACGGAPGVCSNDSDCADGDLCTRIEVCVPASQVRAVRVTWTVQGMPASDATCKGMQFELEFVSSTYRPLAYSPVPCAVGTFMVDKLPTAFTTVRVHRGQVLRSVPIDATTGEAMFETGVPGG